LPERPWEAFLPDEPLRTAPRAVSAPPRVERPPAPAPAHRGRGLAVLAPVAIGVFLLGFATVAAYRPASDAPTLAAVAEPQPRPAKAPPSARTERARRPTAPAPATPAATTTLTPPRATTAAAPAKPRPAAKPKPKQQTRTTPAAAPPKRRTTPTSPPRTLRIAPGRYAGSRGLLLEVTADGRTLRGVLPVPCTALRLAVTAKIEADGTVSGRARGRGPDGPVTAQLKGRFGPPRLLIGAARLQGAGCDTKLQNIAARLIDEPASG
jgi:hypothetical protein